MRAQREALVAGSLDAIRAIGPDISIEQLAGHLGVGRSVLYGLFESKLGIADAIALHFVDALERELSADPPASASETIHRVVGYLVELIDREPAYYGFSVLALQASGHAFLDNGLARALRHRPAGLAMVGTASGDTDWNRILTDALFGFLFAAIESWQTTHQPDRDTLIDELAAAVTRLLRLDGG